MRRRVFIIDSMKATIVRQHVIDEVSIFLETQSRYVEATLKRLDTLRAAVIRRDEGALEQMFAEVQQETQRKTQYEQAMQTLRQSLASVLDLPIERVCLSRFCERLEEPVRKRISERQSTLQSLIRRLNNEVRATEALLHECARFNRLLLNSLFGNQKQNVTYDARGISRWNMQGGLMNMRL